VSERRMRDFPDAVRVTWNEHGREGGGTDEEHPRIW
jgi:hypothetical protein